MKLRKTIATAAVWGMVSLVFAACSTINDPSKKDSNLGLVATPASYYSTPKARYLANKYQSDLNHFVEEIVRNPVTASLQFSNNITSVGGIGFFTHSAVKSADERYLEVILGTPETFESQGEYSAKVARLFSLYGGTLLAILGGNLKMLDESELSGYGLNFSWRTIIAAPSARRVAMERAVVYLDKKVVRSFLRKESTQSEILKDAVIFAVSDDGPMRLVSYQAEEAKPDFRPPIQEADLGSAPDPKQDKVDQVKEAPARPSKPEPQVKTGPQPSEPSPRNGNPTARNVPDERARANEEQVAPEPVKPAIARIAGSPPTGSVALNQNVQPKVELPEVAAVVPNAPPTAVASPVPPAEIAPVIIPVETVRIEKVMPVPTDVETTKVEVSPPVVAQGVPPAVAVAGNAAVSPKPIESGPKQHAVEHKAEISAEPAVQVDAAASASLPTQANAPVPVLEAKAAQPDIRSPTAEAVAAAAPTRAAVPATATAVKAHEAKNPALPPPVPLPVLAERIQKINPKIVQAQPAPVMAKAEVSRVQPPPEIVTPEPSIQRQPEPQKPMVPSAPVRELPTEPAPAIQRTPKALEGYIIQLGFADKAKAQDWAERFLTQGFAVSLTESGGGAIRVRLGNFAVRDDAENKLRALQHDGLKGIIVNLPFRYRPAVSASQP